MLIAAQINETHNPAVLSDALDHTRRAGLDGVEIVMEPGGGSAASEDPSPVPAAHTEPRGVPVLSTLLADGPACRIGVAEETHRAENVDRVRGAARRGARLGAKVLRLIPAAVVDPDTDARQSYQEALNQTWRSLQTLRPDFERSGVVAGVVPCRRGFLLSPPEFRELLDRVNSPWVGAALDWAACRRIGDPADWVATLDHRLAAVDVVGVESAGERDAVCEELRVRGFTGIVIVSGTPA